MEIVGRASVMFIVIYGLLRLLGKREIGQMTPFELVTLIVMGDLIQQSVTHQDFSMTAAVLAIVTFAAWTLFFNGLSHFFPKLRPLLDGEPVVLVRDGKLLRTNMSRERIDRDELASEMRLAGISRIDQVAWAILETEGKISFIRADSQEIDPRHGEDGAT